MAEGVGGSLSGDVSPNGSSGVKGAVGLEAGVSGTLNLCEVMTASCN